MDLSDGSDVEEDIGDVDQDAENVLLGSDDEELNYSRTHSGHHDTGEDNEDKVLDTDEEEEEDVLELALDADEELDEFVEEPLKNNRVAVAPVKVRIQENVEKPQISSSAISQSTIDDPQSTTELDDEEDADTDPKNTRTRFLTERKTAEMNSTPVSVGNPIQILGERKGRICHPDFKQAKSWGNQRPQGPRQFRGPRPPPNRQSLLGDAPRHQGFRPRFPNANEAPVLQFQERIFTDFNQPLPPGQQQQINTVGSSAPMHNPSISNAPRHPSQGNRANHPNHPSNRQRMYKTATNPFLDNGPRPRMQNAGPRPRHIPPQQWKNRPPHPQGGSGMPPEVSGVHPAVIISGNVGQPFQGHGPGHPNSQNTGNPPHHGGPPPRMPNHAPATNSPNRGQQHGPGPNMGHNLKRPHQGPNAHGPPMGPNVHGPRGPRHGSPQGRGPGGPHGPPQGHGPNMHGPPHNPNIQGPPHNPNMTGPPHNSNMQGPPHNPNIQGPPQNPNIHGPPQGHPLGPPSQGPNMHGPPSQGPHVQSQLQPPHHHGPRGPMPGPNPHGHPPGPNTSMQRMVRPNNQSINLQGGPPQPQHANQNFGPVPNSFNQNHPIRPGFDVHNPGNMQKQHIHGDHQSRQNEMPEMGFGQPRPMHPQGNIRPPFGPQQSQFPNPPRLPGPSVEMVENGPYFHQPPGPSNHPPPRIVDQSQPPYWNNPQGPPGSQDPNAWNQHPEHAQRNIVVVQPNNAGDFRGPPVGGDPYQAQHPGPPNHYGSQQYQPYEQEAAPPYMDGIQMGGHMYEQQQSDPYYQPVAYDQYGAEIHPVNPHQSVHMSDHGSRYSGEESNITRTILVSNVHEQENFLAKARREDHPSDYYHSDRLSKKRRSESDDYNPFLSPGKRLNHRLGPPVRSRERERDDQREEAVKIILETKKEMGLDDDYSKKMEDQKRLREQILRKKEERRRLTKGGHESDDYDSGHGHSSFSSRSSGDRTDEKVHSVYINPRAFTGNLGLLNSNLKKVNMNATSKRTDSSYERGQEKAPDVPKTKTILRIVRNKKGKIISQSKVKVLPTEHQKQDGPSPKKTS